MATAPSALSSPIAVDNSASGAHGHHAPSEFVDVAVRRQRSWAYSAPSPNRSPSNALRFASQPTGTPWLESTAKISPARPAAATGSRARKKAIAIAHATPYSARLCRCIGHAMRPKSVQSIQCVAAANGRQRSIFHASSAHHGRKPISWRYRFRPRSPSENVNVFSTGWAIGSRIGGRSKIARM